MEVDVRWSGEPNITFFVELALAGCAAPPPLVGGFGGWKVRVRV